MELVYWHTISLILLDQQKLTIKWLIGTAIAGATKYQYWLCKVVCVLNLIHSTEFDHSQHIRGITEGNMWTHVSHNNKYKSWFVKPKFVHFINKQNLVLLFICLLSFLKYISFFFSLYSYILFQPYFFHHKQRLFKLFKVFSSLLSFFLCCRMEDP